MSETRGVSAIEEHIASRVDSIYEILTRGVEPTHRAIIEKLDRLGDQSQAALTVATEARDLAAEAVKLSKLALEQSRGNGAGIADLIDSLHRVSQRVDVVGKGILTLGASLSELRQLFGEESEYTRERFQELNATGTDPPPSARGGRRP